ncbi:hypothetical protein BDA99DRAFT_529567 [Phascolomyces articulosus]|uniref:Uncharacterized protein n=1 Tax=Phascolomyces articulosus TaxID=60185 RepID=A0AAD5JKT1_9FUNG|nr:hypothetical protein BDA99DRAFT_529567 [Phascolomyces articulosus]
MKNSPKSIFVGWTALAVCALGGYIGSKKYTDYRLRQYTSVGGFSPTAEQGQQTLQKEQDTNSETTTENKPLRRSVQRSL